MSTTYTVHRELGDGELAMYGDEIPEDVTPEVINDTHYDDIMKIVKWILHSSRKPDASVVRTALPVFWKKYPGVGTMSIKGQKNGEKEGIMKDITLCIQAVKYRFKYPLIGDTLDEYIGYIMSTRYVLPYFNKDSPDSRKMVSDMAMKRTFLMRKLNEYYGVSTIELAI